MTSESILGWMKEMLREHLDWVKTFVPADPNVTREELLEAWIKWAFLMGFGRLFYNVKTGVPEGYIIARPVRHAWVYDKNIDYFATLFYYDPAGQIVWIDTIWAPGHYREVLAFLRSTGKKEVAWQHKKRMYVKAIGSLSGSKPVRAQIASATSWDVP